MKLIRVGELSRTLGYSDDSIRRWEHEGRLPKAMRTPGGYLQWDWEMLEPWLIEHGLYFHPQIAPPRTASGRVNPQKASSTVPSGLSKTTASARRRSSKGGCGSRDTLPTI